MITNWQDFLQAAGARIDNQAVEHFGDPEGERAAARSGSVLADLSHYAIIRFAGEDSAAFLQGQLSCDVKQATESRGQFGSYCTPKGRMLATFLLWHDGEGYSLQLPAELREGVQKRLGMYVLRSKVKVSDGSDATVRLGVAGAEAKVALAELGGLPPADDYSMVALEGGVRVLRLPGDRFELVVPPDRAPELWEILSRRCTPVGAGPWEWLEIRAGVPLIKARTQEQFVPQMANLEVIGGVSFTKGCYPGQEIVARAQYLGKVKRRMYLVHIGGEETPRSGDPLFGQGPQEQSGGMIVNAQPAPGGGYDALAVILNSSVEGGAVHWKAADGPALEVLPLPYTVE